MKMLSQRRDNHCTRNNGEERGELENDVAPGQQLVRQEFGKQPVFRGAEEGGLCACQENYRIGHARVAAREGVHGKKHRANFEDLCGDRHAALAKAISKESTGHRKQEERESEQIPNDKNQPIFFRSGWISGNDKKDDNEFKGIAVKKTL